MNYYFWTIGCQMNVADSERIARALHDHGHRRVAGADDADLVLRHQLYRTPGAEDRLWGKLGRLGKLKAARLTLWSP